MKKPILVRAQRERPAIGAQHVAEPAAHQRDGALDEARLGLGFHRNARHVGQVRHLVAVLEQPEPGRLVVAGEELHPAQAPVIDIVFLDRGDEIGTGREVGAEHRHAAGQRQHALADRHGRHHHLALGEAQLEPVAEQRLIDLGGFVRWSARRPCRRQRTVRRVRRYRRGSACRHRSAAPRHRQTGSGGRWNGARWRARRACRCRRCGRSPLRRCRCPPAPGPRRSGSAVHRRRRPPRPPPLPRRASGGRRGRASDRRGP